MHLHLTVWCASESESAGRLRPLVCGSDASFASEIPREYAQDDRGGNPVAANALGTSSRRLFDVGGLLVLETGTVMNFKIADLFQPDRLNSARLFQLEMIQRQMLHVKENQRRFHRVGLVIVIWKSRRKFDRKCKVK